MHNLYYQNLEDTLVNLQTKIKNKITKGAFKSQAEQKNLGLNIKRYQNLCRYNHHRKSADLCNKVNTWFFQYYDYLDTDKISFLSSFSSNYGEKFFELVMAHLVSKKFIPQKRLEKSAIPDLEFIHNQKKYYLDCTTRDSSILLDYLKNFLPNFDGYFEAAKIFYHKNEDLKKEFSCWKQEWWWRSLPIYQTIWRRLDSSTQNFICKQLKLEACPQTIEDKHLEEFNRWITYSQCVLHDFKEILPDSIIKKFSLV